MHRNQKQNDMTEQDKRRLQEIAQQSAISEDDRKFLKAIADELGLQIKNMRCKSCWQDLAIEAALKIREQDADEGSPTNDGRKFVLKKGVDVVFGYPGGIVVNEATLTDELARKLIARGFSKDFFERYEGDEPNEIQRD